MTRRNPPSFSVFRNKPRVINHRDASSSPLVSPATAGISGLAVSAKLAQRYGLVPPDGGAIANEIAPLNDAFKRLLSGGFAEWRLAVDRMVARPMSLSLSDLRSLPVRSQITEVVCEEGPQARYVVDFSIEPDWSESIDMADARHPQTVLTWAMNDKDLPVGFGGPLRLRVPRQLGYKSVKFITRPTVTDSLKRFGKGLGSASPEGGYAWYAGI